MMAHTRFFETLSSCSRRRVAQTFRTPQAAFSPMMSWIFSSTSAAGAPRGLTGSRTTFDVTTGPFCAA